MAVIGADLNGIITSWNAMTTRLFGYEPAAMVGQPLFKIVTTDRQNFMKEAIQRALEHRKNSEFEISHHVPATGDSFTLLLAITPVIDHQNTVQGLAVWGRDISNRKRLQEQLIEAEKMASLGTLASGIAHHFNNIIGGVATFVDYALQSSNPQASRRALQMTAEAAARVSQITSSLLTFAEEDRRDMDLADLTEIIMTFSHLVEGPLREKNITLEMRLQPIPVFEVPGNRFHKLLGNLLSNAEEAMNQGGSIKIGLGRKDNLVVMTFSDTGCGIAPEHLPHIFEPFYTTRGVMMGGNNTSSSGLGLSVVHGIIKDLGGTIQVQSHLNQGTCFTIYFPCEKSGT